MTASRSPHELAKIVCSGFESGMNHDAQEAALDELVELARGALPAGRDADAPMQCPKCKRICDCAEPAERPPEPLGHKDFVELVGTVAKEGGFEIEDYMEMGRFAGALWERLRAARVPVLQPEPSEAAIEAARTEVAKLRQHLFGGELDAFPEDDAHWASRIVGAAYAVDSVSRSPEPRKV